MKAVVYQGPRTIAVQDMPLPALTGPRDAIVRVTRTGICGTDIHPYRGELPQFQPGTVLGHEFAGTLVEAGSEVPFRPGERVFASDVVACGRCAVCARAMHYQCPSVGLFGSSTLVGPAIAGGQAEYVLVPFADTVLCPTPENVSDEQALFVGDVLSTAFMAVRDAHVERGHTVGIVGAGPVGLLAAACASVAGAAHTIVADPHPARRKAAEAAGHLAVPPDEFEAVTKDLSGNWGAHAVVEAVGTDAALLTALRAAGPHATVVAVGVHHSTTANFPSGAAFAKELTLRFTVGDPIAVRAPALALISSGRIDPSTVVSHRLPLASAPDAYAMFDTKQAVKIVLSP